jgi:lipoyl(octanoyl) transferase
MVDLVERINALLQQERNFYTCEDYLSPTFQQKLLENATGESGSDTMLSDSSSSVHSSSSSRINEVWREKICEWAYQVVDHFDFSREVVNISMSFLDRYLSTRLVDKKMFQLAAMTTLYLTVKLYEQGPLSMASMIELSRGYFMVEQMAVMEMSILR